MAAYHEFTGLEHVYLEDSFVLSVAVVPGMVEVFLDVVLLEGHPKYVGPAPGEQYCFRRSVLRFYEVTDVRWRMPKGPPALDASGETDYGGVDEYIIDGSKHQLVGEIGELTIICHGQNIHLEIES